MREIRIILDEKELEKLLKIKGEHTWKELLLSKTEEKRP